MNDVRAFHTAMASTSFVFAFSWLAIPVLFDVTSVILILFFVVAIFSRTATDIRSDNLVRLSVLFFLYVLICIAWHRLTLPDVFPATTSDRRFLRVLYFVAIAYAISRSNLFSPWYLLGTAFGGLLVYLGMSFNETEWVNAWQGHRVDFGIHNAQHTGIVFATSALGFCLFTLRFLRWLRSMPSVVKCIGVPLWMASLAFSLWGIFVTQTRAVWLGLVVALALLPCILFLASSLTGKHQLSASKFFLTSVGGLLLLGLLSVPLGIPTVISDRLSAEKITWDSLKSAAAHENEDLTSVGVRVASWSASIEWIKERPLLGWGGRSTRTLIQQSDLFNADFKANFNHIHNSYLQVLVEIGIVGATFIALATVIMGRACIISYRRQSMPLDVFLFSWSFFAFWLVVNFFESYIIYSTGTYLVAIIAGFTYSFCVKQQNDSPVIPRSTYQP